MNDNDLDRKIKMEIVSQISGPKRGRQGNPALKKNTLLWCIAYEEGGFFTYSYYRKQMAIDTMNHMKRYGTDTKRYYDFNVVSDVDKTLHVMPKGE